MSDYSQITDFSAKDALTSGDPEKIILGADIDAELDAISTAIATKFDSDNVASQAQAEAGSSNAVLMTPLRTVQLLEDSSPAYEIPDAALSSNVPRKNASNTFTSNNTFEGAVAISRATNSAHLNISASDGGTDAKTWGMRITSGGAFALLTRNDAGTAGSTAILCSRSGTTVSSVAINGSTITLNGVDVTNYARTDSANTFTANQTLTGTNRALIVNDGTVQGVMQIDSGNARLTIGTNGAHPVYMFANNHLSFSISSSGNFDFFDGTVTTSKTSASNVGTIGVPLVSKTADYTVVAADAGTCLVCTSAADDITIQESGGLAQGMGVLIDNQTGGSIDIIQGSGSTLILAGTSTTGSRTLAAGGTAYVFKVAGSSYRVGGPGVS